MKRAAQFTVFLLCLAFTAGAIINVFSDNTEVEKMAKMIACQALQPKPGAKPAAPTPGNPDDCAMTMTRMSRTPFGQSFEFTGRNVTRRIGCTRAAILFGSYSCQPE